MSCTASYQTSPFGCFAGTRQIGGFVYPTRPESAKGEECRIVRSSDLAVFPRQRTDEAVLPAYRSPNSRVRCHVVLP